MLCTLVLTPGFLKTPDDPMFLWGSNLRISFPMNINLQIEQILLEGVDLSYRERLQLQAAVEGELSQMVIAKGLPPHLQQGGKIPALPLSMNFSDNSTPAQMGSQIARSIYQGINNPPGRL